MHRLILLAAILCGVYGAVVDSINYSEKGMFEKVKSEEKSQDDGHKHLWDEAQPGSGSDDHTNRQVTNLSEGQNEANTEYESFYKMMHRNITLNIDHSGQNNDNQGYDTKRYSTQSDQTYEKCRMTKTKCCHDPNFSHCYFCPKSELVNGTVRNITKTVCYSVRSSVNVSHILENVNENTTHLELIVDNTWGGYYPLIPHAIDLKHISRLRNLESFEMSMGYYNFLQPYPLNNTDSFQNLTKIRSFRINLPMQVQSIKEMIKPLKNLEVLNISFTRGLGMDVVKDMLGVIANTSLKSLHMQTFQLIGGENYSGILNMTEFLSGRRFERLEELSLSENSLYKLFPGIIKSAPNLKLFDISGNLLLDSENIPALLESGLHPTIEFLDLGYQGFVGGGSHSYRSHGLPLDESNYNFHQQFNHGQPSTHLVKRDIELSTPGKKKVGTGLVQKYINKFIIQCLNTNDRQNISSLLHNKTYFYSTLQCVLPRQFGQASIYSSDILDSLPNITEMLNTDCMLFMKLPIGKKLKKLYFNQIHWEESVTLGAKLKGNLCFMPNQLDTLLFTHNEGWLASAKLADMLNSITDIRGVDNLQHLDLSNNNMTFNITGLAASDYFPNLKYINVAGNNISMPDNFAICAKLRQLKTIDMRHNLLNLNGSYFKISKNIAADCPYLETLYLGFNNMTTGLKLNFSGTYKLKLLDLSHNRMKFLDKTVQQNLSLVVNMSGGVLEVDLRGNELVCGCTEDALEFYRWLVSEKKRINFTSVDQMECVGKDRPVNIGNLDMARIDNMYNTCFPSPVPIILAAVLGSASFIFIVFVSFSTYKNRWKLKYKWFCLTSAFKRTLSKDSESHIKWKYDAFVSYCRDDRFWVHDVLMKSLEEEYSFRLCIHYRDFPVGGSIPVTVSRSMANSREVIVVISELALKSEWCSFELDQAILQAQRRRKPLIVIKIGKFNNPMDHSSAAHVLDRYTYLEWPEQKEGHKLFWAKLIAKMYGEEDGCGCCFAYGAKAIKYNEILDEDTPDERMPLL